MSKARTDEELLIALKKELKRTNLLDSPSRTKLQKAFDKNNIPHPNTYVNRFGSWEKTLSLIGLDYNGRATSAKSAKVANTGKRYASTWSNLNKDEALDAMLSQIHSIGARTSQEYQEKRDKKNSPSLPTITSLTGLKWVDIMSLYRERYGVKLNTDNGLLIKKGAWKEASREEIIDIVIDEIEKIGSTRFLDYEKYRNRLVTPSITTMVSKGLSWSEVTNIYKTREENKNND